MSNANYVTAHIEANGVDPNQIECRYGFALATLSHLLKEGHINPESPSLRLMHKYLSSIKLNESDKDIFEELNTYIFAPTRTPHMRVERE